MEQESRAKKSLLNAKVNLICYFISLLVAFFTRKIFIDHLGVDFVGLTSTLQSILGFLNLAELGIAGAISFVLYKPIFNNDKIQINEIISVFGYLYRCIGLIILGAGIIVSAFLPLIFPNTPFSWTVIYLGFYSYLASSLLGYFVNYKQTLLSADQRNYEVTGYYQAVISTKMILQMILAIIINSFILFLVIEIIFGIIYSIILTMRINKIYPWLKSDIKLGRHLLKKYPEISKYTKQLFVHKIGELVQGQSSPILVYAYTTLPIVAIYGNYNLIIVKLTGLMNSVMMGTNAGIGNLIAEGNQPRIWKTYNELFQIRGCISSIITIGAYFLLTPFIELWIGDEYILSGTIVFIMCIQLYLTIFRGVNDQFLFGYGLFYDTWAPLTESIIFIVTSIIGGMLWGLAGVLLGPVISTLIIIYIWKPYFLFTKGFNLKYYQFLKLFTIQILSSIILYFITKNLFNLVYDINSINLSWSSIILGGTLFIVMLSIIHFIVYYLLFPNFRIFIHRFIKLKYAKS